LLDVVAMAARVLLNPVSQGPERLVAAPCWRLSALRSRTMEPLLAAAVVVAAADTTL
jgi:hypothetical protein